ncbi:phosphoacetylglucosamine mutase [Ktedonobacter racemifer DSM 44963]|uniref:Phosphoacetylglucosamine mutase n=1 Tax=Ktedonobacter racemifer DSM 44963 TaxID=485913 RepID=D6TY51_KTERA|nr:phosphoacetylglucosamine mutase [Ktedonobacter racemifer DSM 44963]
MVLGSNFPADHLVPHLEAILHEGAVISSRETMPFRPKVIQDRPKSGEKPLGLARGFEAPHGALALPRRLMRTFRAVI